MVLDGGAEVAELTAQAADVGVDHAVVGARGGTGPHLTEYLEACEVAVAVFKEKGQDGVLRGGERYGHAVEQGCACGEVYAQGAVAAFGVVRLLAWRGPAAAHHCAHACYDFAQGEGLDYVVVGSGVEGGDGFAGVFACGAYDDADVGGALACGEVAEGFFAVGLAEGVDDDDADVAEVAAQGVGGGGTDVDVVALVGEVAAEQGRDVFVTVYEEYFAQGGSCHCFV